MQPNLGALLNQPCKLRLLKCSCLAALRAGQLDRAGRAALGAPSTSISRIRAMHAHQGSGRDRRRARLGGGAVGGGGGVAGLGDQRACVGGGGELVNRVGTLGSTPSERLEVCTGDLCAGGGGGMGLRGTRTRAVRKWCAWDQARGGGPRERELCAGGAALEVKRRGPRAPRIASSGWHLLTGLGGRRDRVRHAAACSARALDARSLPLLSNQIYSIQCNPSLLLFCSPHHCSSAG